MPILGIDLGSCHTKMATIGGGGLKIVRNDLADRITPTLVSYTDQERLIGDGALTSLKSNFASSIRHFVHLTGATTGPQDESLRQIEAPFALAPFGGSGVGGHLAFSVGSGAQTPNEPEKTEVTSVEALVPYIKNLIRMADNYIGAPVTDVVVAVPVWFGQANRQAIVDACQIAGVRCLRTLNHASATLIDYGLFRRASLEQGHTETVAIVDVGYGQATATVAAYTRTGVKTLAVEESPALGGRTLDALLQEYVVAHFEKATGLNPRRSVKAMSKLGDAVEKAKKALSANSETSINMECFYEDEDINITIKREDFEGLLSQYASDFKDLCARTLAAAKLQGPLGSVEVVGGCTRIPAVRAIIEEVFGQEVKRTMSADECVARGAAIQAAILDPRHRVADFSFSENLNEDILLVCSTFDPAGVKIVDDVNKTLAVMPLAADASIGLASDTNAIVVFPRGTPFTRALCRTVTLPLPSDMSEVTYLLASRSAVVGGAGDVNRVLAHVTVTMPPEVQSSMKEPGAKCSYKLRFDSNDNGVVTVSSVFLREVVVQETIVERTPKKDEQGNVIEGEFDEVKVPKTKTVVRKSELRTNMARPAGWLAPSDLVLVAGNESVLATRDKATVDARAARNELLSMCFRFRQAARTPSTPADEAEREHIIKETEVCEEFAEDNDGLTTAEYKVYIERLVAAFAPVQARLDEFRRQEEEQRLAAQKAAAEAQAAAEKAAREAEEAARVIAEAAEKDAATTPDEVMQDASEPTMSQ